MSKIGRKAIAIGSVQVTTQGQDINYKGKSVSGLHTLPVGLIATIDKGLLFIKADKPKDSEIKKLWGLNRALLANKIAGAEKPFEKVIEINGLGYKAALTGNKLGLSLGFSHKVDVTLPASVTVEIDKTGQRLVFKSADKEVLGQVCSYVRKLRPPEPYKGKGIKFATEIIVRKAGKTAKTAA